MAKLKSIFDRFDADSAGRLSGAQVEQMLVYMNRPVDSVQVRDWLQKLKEDTLDRIEFPEFVAQYSVSGCWSIVSLFRVYRHTYNPIIPSTYHHSCSN